MVKGNTRQVIVVKSPDTKLFEQAIFLLREDALERSGISERELLDEARRVTDGYISRRVKKKRHRLSPLGYFAAGAVPISLAWLLTSLL